MNKLFYIGVYLSERIFFDLYGFTNYADCFAEATTPAEASELAKDYFKTKYRVEATGTKTAVADRKFCRPDFILKKGLQNQNPNFNA